MRFIPNGPDIPDELLAARDAGNVLLFCGAGVSMARAGQPGFVELARDVMEVMGASKRNEARKLFDKARQFEETANVSGLVPTDQIFGLLEHEFAPAEIQEAVARKLRMTPTGHELSAHRAVLDIARGPSGMPRLVTTNFDRMFEECDSDLKVWYPPMLPDPHKEQNFHGVIHIHGVVDEQYQYALDGEFVLSAADFGRAYLAEGWATDYLRKLLERFTIVFIGYTAEDPPIKYLLEALNRFGRGSRQLYAFQSGNEQGAMDRWRQKGVQPIGYDHAERHKALWATLEKWAERARDVEGWHQGLIEMAKQGPESLQPHERGMLAYLASHVEGAHHFVRTGSGLPPQWLLVLDPAMRYQTPEPRGSTITEALLFDPFEVFGLDSDPEPEILDPENRWSKRNIPAEAWDGLTPTKHDRLTLADTTPISIHHDQAAIQNLLPARLVCLVQWIMSIAHHPITLWWAAGKNDLHPWLLDRIDYELRYRAKRFSEPMFHGWQVLLHARQQRLPVPDHAYHLIEMRARVRGWSPSLIREAMTLYQPCLKVHPVGSVAGILGLPDSLALQDILRISVEFLRPYSNFDIPNEHIHYATSLFRSQIEGWLKLREEYSRSSYIFLQASMTLPEKGSDMSGVSDINDHLNLYAKLLERLAKLDARAAREKALLWPINENCVFDRIRIWAAGVPEIHSPVEAAEVLLELSDKGFWDDQHQPNLLNTLWHRWNELSGEHRAAMEQRLLEGAYPWNREDGDINALYNAQVRLNRLYWLRSNKVQFSFDVDREISRLRDIVPTWQEEFGTDAAEDLTGVRTLALNTDFQRLDDLPIKQILVPGQEDESLDLRQGVNQQPFLGMVNAKPEKALAALESAASRGYYPRYAWSFMLQCNEPQATTEAMLVAVGSQVAKLPHEALGEIADMVTWWLRRSARTLFALCPDVFNRVWGAMIHVLSVQPAEKGYRRPNKSWMDEAINHPVGHMAEAAFESPDLACATSETGLPAPLKDHLNALLALDERRAAQAAVISCTRLSWLFNRDPDWCEHALLQPAIHDGPIRQALFEGLLIYSSALEPGLFQRLKLDLFSLAEVGEEQRQVIHRLAGFVLLYWGHAAVDAHETLLVSSPELRELLIHASETYRLATLDHLLRFANNSAEWKSHIVSFLKDVWPRQVRVRTSEASGRLAGLTLSAPLDQFPVIVDMVARTLKPVKGALYRLNQPGQQRPPHASEHPQALLELLWGVLPVDPLIWPAGVKEWLEELEKQPAVSGDERLLRLLRIASFG